MWNKANRSSGPYDGLLVDVDGVVLLGGEILVAAEKALRLLRAMDMPFMFVTNNVTRPRIETEQLLRRASGGEDFILVDPLDVLMERETSGLWFVLGSDHIVERLGQLGLDATNVRVLGVDKILITSVIALDYALLVEAARGLRLGIPGWATGLDRTFHWRAVAWPGVGAIVAFLEYASQSKIEVLGKPSPNIFDLARRRFSGKLLMVGDDPLMDIEGATNAGIESALVLTGVTASVKGLRDEPVFVGRDLMEVAEFALRKA